MKGATTPRVLRCVDLCGNDASAANGSVHSGRSGTASALANPPTLGAGHVRFLRQHLQVKHLIAGIILKAFCRNAETCGVVA